MGTQEKLMRVRMLQITRDSSIPAARAEKMRVPRHSEIPAPVEVVRIRHGEEELFLPMSASFKFLSRKVDVRELMRKFPEKGGRDEAASVLFSIAMGLEDDGLFNRVLDALLVLSQEKEKKEGLPASLKLMKTIAKTMEKGEHDIVPLISAPWEKEEEGEEKSAPSLVDMFQRKEFLGAYDLIYSTSPKVGGAGMAFPSTIFKMGLAFGVERAGKIINTLNELGELSDIPIMLAPLFLDYRRALSLIMSRGLDPELAELFSDAILHRKPEGEDIVHDDLIKPVLHKLESPAPDGVVEKGVRGQCEVVLGLRSH